MGHEKTTGEMLSSGGDSGLQLRKQRNVNVVHQRVALPIQQELQQLDNLKPSIGEYGNATYNYGERLEIKWIETVTKDALSEQILLLIWTAVYNYIVTCYSGNVQNH